MEFRMAYYLQTFYCSVLASLQDSEKIFAFYFRFVFLCQSFNRGWLLLKEIEKSHKSTKFLFLVNDKVVLRNNFEVLFKQSL